MPIVEPPQNSWDQVYPSTTLNEEYVNKIQKTMVSEHCVPTNIELPYPKKETAGDKSGIHFSFLPGAFSKWPCREREPRKRTAVCWGNQTSNLGGSNVSEMLGVG